MLYSIIPLLEEDSTRFLITCINRQFKRTIKNVDSQNGALVSNILMHLNDHWQSSDHTLGLEPPQMKSFYRSSNNNLPSQCIARKCQGSQKRKSLLSEESAAPASIPLTGPLWGHILHCQRDRHSAQLGEEDSHLVL